MSSDPCALLFVLIQPLRRLSSNTIHHFPAWLFPSFQRCTTFSLFVTPQVFEPNFEANYKDGSTQIGP